MLGLSTHQAVLCDTSWVSYNWIQFWHSPPGDSIRSHRLKSRSHKTSTPQLQMPVTSPTSFMLLTTWLSVGIPTTHFVGLTIYSNDPQKSGKHIYQCIISLFNPINHKGNQTWIFIGRTDAEGEAPILWPHDAKSELIGEDPDAGKDWREEKGTTEDEMVGWYHRLNGTEFEQAPGDGEGQGSLACCSPWGHKVSDMTDGLNNSNKQKT